MEKLRIFLADDHTVLRQGVRLILEAEPDITVIGEAADSEETCRLVPQLKPDILLLDVKMPGLGGLALLPSLIQVSPRTAIIVFTMYDNPGYVYQALRAGARGYILKNVEREELLRAIRAVFRGGGFIQAEVTRPLLKRLSLEVHGGQDILTTVELGVLQALADGKLNKEIAYELGISEETVKTHLKHIYEKLGASARTHAVAIALRQRLIE
jgi:DNA-binding NarL/FixJ family response regulator